MMHQCVCHTPSLSLNEGQLVLLAVNKKCLKIDSMLFPDIDVPNSDLFGRDDLLLGSLSSQISGR